MTDTPYVKVESAADDIKNGLREPGTITWDAYGRQVFWGAQFVMSHDLALRMYLASAEPKGSA